MKPKMAIERSDGRYWTGCGWTRHPGLARRYIGSNGRACAAKLGHAMNWCYVVSMGGQIVTAYVKYVLHPVQANVAVSGPAVAGTLDRTCCAGDHP